jgi:hopanoid biosynthesis associated protein HpnK
MKSLIVTADDFGVAVEVNDAVEQAHAGGILTAASLMVGGGAVADAVARARRLPTLAVGLHIVLVEGRPVLPPADIPDLVGPDGFFRRDMVACAVDIFFKPRARRQLAAEITAQFEAYRATGLPLDHVNTHKHFHLHPTIAGHILKIGKAHGLNAMRVPLEPRDILMKADGGAMIKPALVTGPWSALVRWRLGRAGVATADRVFGLAWSGAMTRDRVRGLIEHLPDGITELYVHPATAGGFDGEAPGYLYAEELAALTAPDVLAAVRASGARLGGFADVASARGDATAIGRRNRSQTSDAT